jgi:hypothetical protein
VRALKWPPFALSAWTIATSVLAGTTCEVAALASVRVVGVRSASHCGGGHDRGGRCSGLFSIGGRELRQPRCWRARQVRTLIWPLFDRSTWAQPDTVLAGTTVEGAILASDRSVGVGSISHCGGEHDS